MHSVSSIYATRACREFALEQNRKLFAQANSLSTAALDILDRPVLNAEVFDHYQALRRKADLKSEEAIDHLRLINDEFPSAAHRHPTQVARRPLYDTTARV